MKIDGQCVPGPLWARSTASASPIGALLLLYGGLMATLRTSTLTPACMMIGVSMGLLVAGGTCFASLTCMPRAVRVAMWVTAAVACLGWGWQRMAYLLLIPNRFLMYGYFLSPPGTTARVYMMEAPLELGAALFVAALVYGTLSAWRAGARWLIAVLAAWWFTAYLIYASASLHLWAQGDAAIFI